MPQSKKVARPKLPKPGVAPRTRTEVTDDDARSVRRTVQSTDRLSDESTSPQADKSAKRGIVERRGRQLANGQRVGKGEASKSTYYIPVDVADEIAIIARRRRMSASDVAAEALAEYIARQADEPRAAGGS